MEPITIFSWGYWGWGNATSQLVKAVDAVEKSRGYQPPLFVDVRISRSVRAIGFRDSAFERLLGRDRYKWLRGLGNRAVETREGPPIQIADPATAGELLEIALESAAERRHVLFFCSCEWPVSCHRTEVARLVRETATRRGVPVQTVEWPGGSPVEVDLDVPVEALRMIRRGRKSVPLGKRFPLDRLAGLPWGSTVRLHAKEARLAVLAGPARCQSDGWSLPVLRLLEGREAGGSFGKTWGTRFRREYGYLPTAAAIRPRKSREFPGLDGKKTLFESCVYTIAHVDKLRGIAERGGKDTLSEGRQWVTGRQLLERALRSNQAMPVVFADAADCSRLLFWAVLTRIDNTDGGARYSFVQLQPIRGRHSPQELTLLSTGKKIAADFIRPYAVCRTPSFLRAPGTARVSL